ncbi:MAG: quinone oxidoreductase [Rhodospirillales bacterium 20-60-12]|nr:MAG: quinone oxidoreductase [Rhodospirillales bacterium 20-60-12]HQT66534.1 zinc-binding dehydrogenase [Acetobacteraceae bacterium]
MAQIIRMTKHGAPSVLRLETVEIGRPGPGEVRLVQDAIGVNYVDTMVRDGRFALPLPLVPGFEGAGVVAEVDESVDDFAVGDRVGYFFSAGGYASERLISASDLIALPDDISTEQAAMFLAAGLTAWMGLHVLHPLRRGEIVLVQGASGSVGTVISRWAKALGATVIGVAGSATKLAKVTAGADHGFHATDPQLLDKMRAIAPKGVDVVYDMVGKAVAAQTVAAVRDGGKIVAIGGASGPPGFDQEALAQRRVTVVGGGTPQHVHAGTVGGASAALFAAIQGGLFADIPAARYKLGEAPRVHEDIAARRVEGLPILLP